MSTQDKKQQFQFFDIDQIDNERDLKNIEQSKVTDKKEDTQLMQYSQSTVNVKNQFLQQSGRKDKTYQNIITQSLKFSIKPSQQPTTNLNQSDSLSIGNSNRRGQGRRLIRRKNQNNNTQTSNDNINSQPLNNQKKTQTQKPTQEIRVNLINQISIKQMSIKQVKVQNNDHLNDEQIRNLIATGVQDHTHSYIGKIQQNKQELTINYHNQYRTKQLTISQEKNQIKMTQSKVIQPKIQNNNSSLLGFSSSNTTNPIEKLTKSQLMDNLTLKQSDNSNVIISGSKTSSINLNQNITKDNDKERVENITLNQERQKDDLVSGKNILSGIKCSLLEMSQLPQKIQSIKFSISQLSSSTNNTDWHSSPLAHLIDQFSSINPIRYYGFSQNNILSTQNNHSQQRYNRQLLLGAKSKLKRQINQQNNAEKINQKKTLYLYLQDNLLPLTQRNITLKESSNPINFLHHVDYQHRLNIVIDLLQTFSIIHKLDFMLFPHTIFAPQVQNSVLFIKDNHSKSQFQPHLKLSIHLLQSYQQHKGNSSKPFDLKTFIASQLKIDQQKNNSKKQVNQTKKQKETKLGTIKSQYQKTLKSPQIRFYHLEWYWKIWNKLLSQFASLQLNKTYVADLVTPKWIDLFQIPLHCLKFLYGNEMIQKLCQKKFNQIQKEVHKVLSNQKAKKIQNSDEQIIKICQKPFIQWTEYEQIFKQEHQKQKKLDFSKKQHNSTIKQRDFLTPLLKHPNSKKVFEQIISCLSMFPIHQLSKQKYENKRVFSLQKLIKKLKPFRVIKRPNQISPVLIKLMNKKIQQQSHQNEKKKKVQSFQKGLTILSSQSTKNQIIDLKNKYFDLLKSTNLIRKQQFDNQYVKKQQTHLLTSQLKKKLNTVFSSHHGIMKIPKRYTLINKSSVFNFSVKKFYQLCENKQNLLYVLKVKNDRTIFYFNQQKIIRSRQSNGLFGGFIKDLKGTSFFYTGDEVLKVKNPQKSFGVSHLHGPIMGQGDIIIKQGNLQNECHYPKSYETTKKSKKVLKSTKFELQEMDIYEVLF